MAIYFFSVMSMSFGKPLIAVEGLFIISENQLGQK